MEKEELKKKIEELLDQLSDDERLEVFGLYCKACGIKGSCQCWNDE